MLQILPGEVVLKMYQIRLLREDLDQKLMFFHMIQSFMKPVEEKPALLKPNPESGMRLPETPDRQNACMVEH